jgi:hypothetical protein
MIRYCVSRSNGLKKKCTLKKEEMEEVKKPEMTESKE